MGGIGLAMAWFLAYNPTEATRAIVDAKIGILVEHNLGWLFLGIFFVKLLQVPLHIILGEARKASKVAVPNQHVYRIMASERSWLGYVLMETEGEHGAFNRASTLQPAGSSRLRHFYVSWYGQRQGASVPLGIDLLQGDDSMETCLDYWQSLLFKAWC